jgi:hypothetical protein
MHHESRSGSFVALAAIAVLGGCCFGSHAGPADAGPVAFDPTHAGEGQMPTPAILFAGVESPYPNPQAPRGTQGAIVRSGSATVRTVSGNLPGVTAGSACSYVEFRNVGDPRLDCRWNVTCGSYVLYGLGTGGYGPCEDRSWAAGTLAMDVSTSRVDTDPSIVFNTNGLSVSDDAAGRLGAFTVTMGVP